MPKTQSTSTKRTHSSDPSVAGDKKRKSAPTEPQEHVFVLMHSVGGKRPEEHRVIGAYSSKQLAAKSAKAKFEVLSDGWYKNGKWDEPYLFLETVDNTSDVKDVDGGTVIGHEEQNGAYCRISIHRTPLDEKLKRKKKQKPTRKRAVQKSIRTEG